MNLFDLENKILPSILSADFSRLGEEVSAVRDAGVKMVHVDVMDGHFVPPITFGYCAVQAIKKSTDLLIDVHLMVSNPRDHFEQFVKSGADIITFHYEAVKDPRAEIEILHSLGVKAGLAINPLTPIESIYGFEDVLDLALIMTVNPGWGGQKMIESTLGKIKEYQRYLNNSKSLNMPIIEVDGGVSESTISVLKESGAELFVAGSAVFSKDNYRQAIEALNSKLNS